MKETPYSMDYLMKVGKEAFDRIIREGMTGKEIEILDLVIKKYDEGTKPLEEIIKERLAELKKNEKE